MNRLAFETEKEKMYEILKGVESEICRAIQKKKTDHILLCADDRDPIDAYEYFTKTVGGETELAEMRIVAIRLNHGRYNKRYLSFIAVPYSEFDGVYTEEDWRDEKWFDYEYNLFGGNALEWATVTNLMFGIGAYME